MCLKLFLLLIQCAYLNVAAAFEFWDSTIDWITGERCIDRWISGDMLGFQQDLRQHVFGQPFLEEHLLHSLKNHLHNDNPGKALVFSFHGSPGVGKTFVGQRIAKFLFKQGTESSFYKFIPLSDSILTKKKDLMKMIEMTVRQCSRSLFVFDEIEKVPAGVFEDLKQYIDYHPNVNGVDYRKSIFIFISNIGESVINDLSLNYWKQGIPRRDYVVEEFEKLLLEETYNREGGLQKTRVVKNYLVSMYVPFLPLEKEHVEKCIEAESKELNLFVSKKDIQRILNGLVFLPNELKVYSASGCKNIESLLWRYGKHHDEL